MLHKSTFEYLKPTDEQMKTMALCREAFATFASIVDNAVPDCADKTHALRLLRTAAMWINVAITREQDGTPRHDLDPRY